MVVLGALALLVLASATTTASGLDGRLRGFVTDSVSGAAIVGASVRLTASDLPWAFGTTTDVVGYFEFAVPPHRYDMSASSSSHLGNSTPVAVGSGHVVWANLTLASAPSRSARLRGFVTETGSGVPVTLGRIVARPPWWAGPGSYRNESSLDASGYYSMALVPGSYEVATDGVIGFAPYVDYPVSIGTGQTVWYNISLDPNPIDAWINGTVYDADTSARIGGAEVTARVDGLLLPSVTADGSGAYSLQVPSGTVELAADAPGYAPASTSVNAWSGGQYVEDLYLSPLSRSVRGYVRDGVTGEPLADVTVTVAPLFFNGYYDQASTNASGYYEVAVPDDYYVVSARQPGYTSWFTWVIFFSSSTAWANATLWPIVSTISGYLVDAVDGGPVLGLVVTALDVRTSYAASTIADASGFFTFRVPPSPAMSVWVSGQEPYAGNVAYVGTEPYATTWVNITVERLAAQIIANVTNALTGTPVAGATVSVSWIYGYDWGATDANGSATVDSPAGLTVYVTAFASGYNIWTGVVVPSGGRNALPIALLPDLTADVRVRGWVRDGSSGLGIDFAEVEALGYDTFPPNDYTNSTGYYELRIAAAPQTIRAMKDGYTAGEALVTPASGETIWVNLTISADAAPPQVVTFTASPSSGIDESNPAALVADVSEGSLARADVSILMLHTAAAGVGTFLNLGTFDPSRVAVSMTSPGSYRVSTSWDTRTPVGRLSDGAASVWWPVFTVAGGPHLAIVTGYWDNSTLASPIAANAVFDSRDGRLLYVVAGSEFIDPQDQPASTFAPYAAGTRIDLTTAAIRGSALVTGPALSLGTLRLTFSPTVPSGTYAGLLQLSDSAGAYVQAAVLMETAVDTVPPTANAGPDFTMDEDAPGTLDGSASTDNVGITSYEWTFVDGLPRTLSGATPTYTFATPGTYVITLTVRDAYGNVATDTVTVTVRDVTDPIVSMTAPSEGATISGSLTVRANATDNVAVVRVELRVDGTSAGNDTAAPFEFLIPAGTLAAGNHTLEVVAYDAAGNAASQVRRVIITPYAGTGPGLDLLVLGGLGALPILAAIAAALLVLRRRRVRRPPIEPPQAQSLTQPETRTAPAEMPTEPDELDALLENQPEDPSSVR